MLKSMKDADPAPTPQLALPVVAIEAAACRAWDPHASPQSRAVADLITTAFYFLLRVGEYTMPAQNRRTRTVQFRCQDVRLWKNGRLIPHLAPLQQLLSADGVTLYLDNQKNGQRGSTVHHTSADGQFCPVKALARRVHAIRSSNMPPSTPLSYLGPGSHIIANDILRAVRLAAADCQLQLHGYNLKRIGSHSLRASGAMALKLNGYDMPLIMKLGRWSSTTFLTYIHSQIAALTQGVASRMARRIEFHNVGG